MKLIKRTKGISNFLQIGYIVTGLNSVCHIVTKLLTKNVRKCVPTKLLPTLYIQQKEPKQSSVLNHISFEKNFPAIEEHHQRCINNKQNRIMNTSVLYCIWIIEDTYLSQGKTIKMASSITTAKRYCIYQL